MCSLHIAGQANLFTLTLLPRGMHVYTIWRKLSCSDNGHIQWAQTRSALGYCKEPRLQLCQQLKPFQPLCSLRPLDPFSAHKTWRAETKQSRILTTILENDIWQSFTAKHLNDEFDIGWSTSQPSTSATNRFSLPTADWHGRPFKKFSFAA